MSPRNKHFIGFMVGILVIAAFVGFVLVSPGPVRPEKPQTTQVTRSVGRGAPATPAKPAVTNDAGQSGTSVAPTNGAAPSDPAPKAPATPAANPRGGQPQAYMQAHELFALIDADPKSVASITFLNGSERIHVLKTNDRIKYIVTLPEDGGRAEVLKLARQHKIMVKAEEDSTASLRSFVFSFGPMIVIGLIILFMLNRARGGGMGGRPGFGKSRAASAEDGNLRKVTFDDVAGCDEAVKELRRIARGLRRRRLYSWFGAKLPKGVILTGPPGTGKTLLARALAGETEGSFDATSGSDFVEMFVGVGASRVRDMFEQGRAKVKKTGKPHVIFIDEIDAIGGKRGGGGGESTNTEREQTLNAILVEMDGMKNNDGLIIIAATNRIDMLDEALTRPGRFDSHVTVDLPTTKGRAAIFRIHTRNKPLDKGVSCDLLASRTFGYSGAEIESACNRAAILAAERCGVEIPEEADDKVIEEMLGKLEGAILLSEFDEGIDFVRFGSANPERQKSMSEKDKKNTTVHEAGHACASDVMEGSDPIVKITILNRSKALGYVQNMPSEDRYGFNVKQIVARMVTAMAGRAAQELVLGEEDTGASNDYEQATRLAHNMVTKWGLSKLGKMSVGRGASTGMKGMGSGPVAEYGPKLADAIDDEWRRIIDAAEDIALYIIETDRERLDKLVELLSAQETVLGPEWEAFRKEFPSKVDPKRLVIDLTPERRKKGQ